MGAHVPALHRQINHPSRRWAGLTARPRPSSQAPHPQQEASRLRVHAEGVGRPAARGVPPPPPLLFRVPPASSAPARPQPVSLPLAPQARKLESELDIKVAAYGKLCSGYEYGYSKGESGLATDQVRMGTGCLCPAGCQHGRTCAGVVPEAAPAMTGRLPMAAAALVPGTGTDGCRPSRRSTTAPTLRRCSCFTPRQGR